MAKEKKDIFVPLPSEAFVKIDEIGYSFLKEHGYDVEGACASDKKRKEIKRALKANNEELHCRVASGKSDHAIIIWFELYRGKKKVAMSDGLKLLPKKGEEAGDDKV